MAITIYIWGFLIWFSDWSWTWTNNISGIIFDTFLMITVALSALYYLISFVSIIHTKKEILYQFINDKAPFVTVQIPTFNEVIALRCAKRCLELDYPKERYEILIGDDSNNKDVSARIDAFAEAHSNVHVLRRGGNEGYKPGNLNNMLKYTNGEIIVIFDSDFLPPKNFLRRIVAPFMHSEDVQAVQARWTFLNANKNLITILASTILEVVHRIVLALLYSKYKISFICGSAEAVRKDTLVRLGGWKTGSLTEDIDYSLRLLKSGYRIVYLNNLECASEVPFTPSDYYRQQMRWAYGVTRAYIDHGIDILKSRILASNEKLCIYFVGSGYMLTFLIMILIVSGFINFITNPAEPINFQKFFGELGRNILITSGFLFASAVALYQSRNLSRLIKAFISSFSYGLVAVYYTNKGVIKAFLNKPMKWYMLNKTGMPIRQK